MKIRIETTVAPAALQRFLDENKVRVPTFFDKEGHVVLLIGPYTDHDQASKLISWLMLQR